MRRRRRGRRCDRGAGDGSGRRRDVPRRRDVHFDCRRAARCETEGHPTVDEQPAESNDGSPARKQRRMSIVQGVIVVLVVWLFAAYLIDAGRLEGLRQAPSGARRQPADHRDRRPPSGRPAQRRADRHARTTRRDHESVRLVSGGGAGHQERPQDRGRHGALAARRRSAREQPVPVRAQGRRRVRAAGRRQPAASAPRAILETRRAERKTAGRSGSARPSTMHTSA